VRFVGAKLDSSEAALASKLKYIDIEVVDPVPYIQSVELMSASDALIVIDANLDINPFLPSKVIDYVGTGKPIIALTPNGPTKDLLDELGCPVLNPEDIDGFTFALEKFIESIQTSKFKFNNYEIVRERYSAHTNSNKYFALLNQASF